MSDDPSDVLVSGPYIDSDVSCTIASTNLGNFEYQNSGDLGFYGLPLGHLELG